MEQRLIKVRGGGVHISEYQTTRTGGFVWEAAYVLLRYIEQNGFPGQVSGNDAPGSVVELNEVGGSRADLASVVSASAGDSTPGAMQSEPRSEAEEAALRVSGRALAGCAGGSSEKAPVFRILDFSGGTGMLGIASAQLAPSSHVVISEFSSTALDQIRHNCIQSGVDPARCVAAKYAWGKTDAEEFIAAHTMSDGAVHEAGGVNSVGDEVSRNIDAASPSTDMSQAGSGFDVVLCSDCLFITVRDGRECDFVSSLVSLCHDKTVVLTAHKMRLWEQEELVVQLLHKFFEVREIKVSPGDGLMDDFFGSGGDEGGGMFGMFEEAPEIYFCEMKLRGPDDTAADGEKELGTGAHASAQSRRQLALGRLQSIDALWSEICAQAEE
eukprot:INCI19006.1.p1 GENE.INCI19006.1~~INCI19006.1.p1  ORF type:complete len:383 (-),score=78.79 INCI19006.1:445-1593(-)